MKFCRRGGFLYKNQLVTTLGGTRLRHLLSFVGLGCILYSLLSLESGTLWPSWQTVIPVLGAAILLWVGPQAWVNRYLLSLKPLVFVGLISYSLYLWHWPFLAYKNLTYPQASMGFVGGLLLASVVVAIATYYGLERPFIRSFGRWKKWSLGLVLVGLLAAGQFIRLHDGLPSREALNPSLMAMLNRTLPAPEVFHKKWEPGQAIPNVLMMGDSHIEQHLARVDAIENQYPPLNAQVISHRGTLVCPMHTQALAQQVESLLASGEVKSLLIGQQWDRYYKREPQIFAQTLQWYNALIARYRSVHFYFMLDAPWDDGGQFSVKERSNRWDRSTDYTTLVASAASSSVWKEGNQVLQAGIHKASNVSFVDPGAIVCPQGICPLNRYQDDDHLYAPWVKTHGVWIDPIMKETQRRLLQ